MNFGKFLKKVSDSRVTFPAIFFYYFNFSSNGFANGHNFVEFVGLSTFTHCTFYTGPTKAICIGKNNEENGLPLVERLVIR